MILGDKNAVLIASRILAYGPEYNVEVTNPNDVEQNKLRSDHAICVFDDCENRYDILKELWNGTS